MSTCLAFAALFSPLTHLGLDSILIRELVSKPEQRNTLLGTGFAVKFCGSSVALVLALIAGYYHFKGEILNEYIIFWQMFSFLALSFDVVDLLYQSMVKSKYTVYAKNLSFIIGSAFRLYFLWIKAPLLWFVIVQTSEFALAMVFGLYFLFRQGMSPFKWNINWPLARKLVSESWVVAISSFVIMLYMKIDQVMTESIAGKAEAGIYQAAVRLSEVWYFIPLAVVSSVMPSIIKAYQTDVNLAHAKLQRLFDVLTWIALSAAITMQFAAPYIIKVYKAPFWPASNILVLHIWAGLFVSLGSASSHYFIMRGLSKLNFYRTLAGATSNILLNIWLIPIYGGWGAALATLISYAISDYFSNLFIPKTRHLFGMFISAFNLPRIVMESLKKS
jgi:PST family polysaccharide transporter